VNVVKIILGIIFLIDCIALTIVVLMQEGKQQGLGAIAGAAETYWGKNKGRSMEGGLVKATTVMGILFFVLAVVLNISYFILSYLSFVFHFIFFQIYA
jgi:preprotein translocase subunit SecG